MRFDPAGYPGPRPDGPAIVYQQRVWPAAVGAHASRPVDVAHPADGAPVLIDPDRRWVVAYGMGGCPDALIDRGLDVSGALSLPASLIGFATAWEDRRGPTTGTVELTLVSATGSRFDTTVLGIRAADTMLLDTLEGRGSRYALGRVGPVAVGARFVLEDALAYGPVEGARVLGTAGRLLTYPAVDQRSAGAAVAEGHAVSLGVEPLPGRVDGPWPPTPLGDLDLFAYGTLAPGGEYWAHLEPLVTDVGTASVAGVVVDTFYGWPAGQFDHLRAAGRRVSGTLLRPRGADAAAETYRRADEIETAAGLFRRVAVRVARADGSSGWAAAYEWNEAEHGPPPGG